MTVPICCKNEEIALNKDNVWEGDLFKRAELATNYTKIIQSIIQPYVLSINAKYGSGKTFFLRRWSEELKNNDEHVVFFNAWDCDYVEKPLLPFLYNILEQLKEQGIVNYSFGEDLKNCKDIIVNCFKNFIDKSSGGIVNIDELKQHTNANSMKVPQITTLEEYQQLQETLNNFKIGLNKIVEKLEGKNLYIFIDELERCRPTFAVELLEVIKHLFNIKGIVFILGIDRNQLKHTISSIYGCGMDGDGYLRRFIDLELELPQASLKDFTHFLKKKFMLENDLSDAYRNWVIGYDQFHSYFEIFSELYDFQLRDVEQIYGKFNVITKMIDEKVLKITPVLALLMILKLKDNDLYEKFTLSKLTLENISEFLETNIFNKIIKEANKRELDYFRRICLALQPINYDDLTYETEDINKKRLYNELYKMQNHTCPYDIDRIQYLKNMISCISITQTLGDY